MTRYLTKNHQELDRILNSVPRHIRNDRKKLASEWNGLRQKIISRNNIIFKNVKKPCKICRKTHLLYFCNHHNCEICGIRGHQKRVCDTPIYYINLLYLCGCDARKCKNIRSRLNKENNSIARYSTHCCNCNSPTPLESMMKYNNKMICEYCETDKKSRSQKRLITPPLSPRPDKQMKPINEVIEELPPPEDPIESMELDEPQSSTTPTYAQVASATEDIIPPKPQKKYLECVNCGRDTEDNHKKSSMTKVNIDEFTLLCEKCTMMKENQERYGSSRPIKQCKVCKIHTDCYESRAGGDIVCGSLCNDTLTTINKIYSDKRYNQKASEEFIEEIIQHKCQNVARKRFDQYNDDVYESDPEDDSTIGISRPTSVLKGYDDDLYINVKKYMNDEFEDKPWIKPEQMDQVIDSVNELIPKSIPNEIMNQITKEVIDNNRKNVKLFFDDNIKVNPDSKPQWNRDDNPLLPINPDTWEDADTDEIEISHPEKMKLFEQELKDTKKNANKDIRSTTPPKKVIFDEQITVKISDLEKPDTTPSNDQENWKIIQLNNLTISKLEQQNEEGYQINQGLENDNKNLRKRNQELIDTIAQQNMQLENSKRQKWQLETERNHWEQIYKNEWMVCDLLTKDITKLTERIDNLLNKKSNDTLSRRFIMKLQTQIIRRKDNELKEFAKRINQLQEKVEEYRLLNEQWQNPDLSQIFSPDTITVFNDIVEQCETNLERIDNDNNPDIVISEQDIELISKYLEDDMMM